jgi:hypothetical protein
MAPPAQRPLSASRSTRPRRATPRLAAAALALVILGLFPAAASALTWGARVPVDPSPDPTNFYTKAIECPTTGLCIVGGYGDRIATSTDPEGGAGTWSVGAVPGAVGAQIERISCPSTSLCVAVDGSGEALVSTDPAGGAGTWSVTSLPKPGGGERGFIGLSCPSASLCVATGGALSLLTGLPTAPATWAEVSLPRNTGDVSCTADGTCVAVGGTGVFTTTTPADESSWAEASIDPFNGSSYIDSIASVSCVPGLCVGGGSGGAYGARVYWSQHPTGGEGQWSSEVLTSNLGEMECVSEATVLCVGSSIYGTFVWTSTNPAGGAGSWVLTEDATNGGDPTIYDNIAGVSCPTTARCFAATLSGYVVMGIATPGGESPVPGHEPGTGHDSGVKVGPPKVRFLKNAISTNAIGFLLESAQYATGALSGVTAGSYSYAGSSAVAARAKHAKRKHLSLGKVRFHLEPHTPKLVKLKLRRPIRRLLAKHHTLPIKITISLQSSSGRRSVTHRRVTLKRRTKHRSHRA